MGVFHVFQVAQMIPNRGKHLISHSSHYPHIICQFLFNSDTICSKNGVQRRGFAFQRISVSLVTISADIILIEFFKVITLFNLFHATGIFLYLLKISEIQTFSVFKGYINRPVVWNGLKVLADPVDPQLFILGVMILY